MISLMNWFFLANQKHMQRNQCSLFPKWDELLLLTGCAFDNIQC